MTEQTKRAVNTLRVISAEVINNANSGHSGIALGAAPILYSVYSSMKLDTMQPAFFNRDRFVLSAGHGSALLYTTLHFMGFNITTENLRSFRKIGSKLPGHPELDTEIGVDCSTGPLGQGVAMAVGIALAEKKLAVTYNKEGFNIIDHYTFCVAGDGCLMEGVSYEACNLAGLWKLNKLIMLYDSNEVTLDGTRASADSENVRARFEAAQWNVLEVADGNDADAISESIEQAKSNTDSPTLIIVKTQIGYGTKNEGTSKAHGAVLTKEEIIELRQKFDLTKEYFDVDGDVKKHFANLSFKHLNKQKQWQDTLARYKKQYPDEYKGLSLFWGKDSQKYSFDSNRLEVTAEGKDMATRDAGHSALNQIVKQSPRIWGGSADISSTTKAFVKDGGVFGAENPTGADVSFGVREFAMATVMNGVALHGFTPYCSTFLAFSDYCKAAIRLTALMKLPVTYVFSHDGLGNAPDGATHQAGEHIAALRLIPDLAVFRPCDDTETAAVYKWVFDNGAPAAIILSRGSVPSLEYIRQRTKNKINDSVSKGGYILSESDGKCSAVLVSSGSEVSLCVGVQEMLKNCGVGVRVVSMPSMELFDSQKEEYKKSVLGKDLPIIAVEMGASMPWYKYISKNGKVIGFDRFGGSGKDDVLREELGFTVDRIAKTVLDTLKN